MTCVPLPHLQEPPAWVWSAVCPVSSRCRPPRSTLRRSTARPGRCSGAEDAHRDVLVRCALLHGQTKPRVRPGRCSRLADDCGRRPRLQPSRRPALDLPSAVVTFTFRGGRVRRGHVRLSDRTVVAGAEHPHRDVAVRRLLLIGSRQRRCVLLVRGRLPDGCSPPPLRSRRLALRRRLLGSVRVAGCRVRRRDVRLRDRAAVAGAEDPNRDVLFDGSSLLRGGELPCLLSILSGLADDLRSGNRAPTDVRGVLRPGASAPAGARAGLLVRPSASFRSGFRLSRSTWPRSTASPHRRRRGSGPGPGCSSSTASPGRSRREPLHPALSRPTGR